MLLLILAAGARSQPQFRFTPVDETLLDQANQLDAKIARKGLLYEDPVAQAYVSGIGQQLLTGVPPQERVNFQFRIIRDSMVNAFALPNGSIYVNTGLIAAVRNEAQLASVLSHEITHVTGRHAYLENRSIRKKNVGIDVLAAAAAAAGIRSGLFGVSVVVVAETSQVFVIASAYGYSRDIERDADRGGYAMLVHASYDGKAMTDTLEILDEKIEYEPTQPFWRTHPKLQERIATSKALTLQQPATHPRETEEGDYLGHLAPVVRYNIQLDLDSRRVRTALDRAQRLVDWAPSDIRNITLLADAWAGLGAKAVKPDAEELTGRGKKENRRRLLKETAEEEQEQLAARPDGGRILSENRSKAESLYKRAIQNAPQLAEPHRGLGMLYDEETRNAEAAAEYRSYLNLAPQDAVDRLRIERRLEKVAPGKQAK